jgi:hypothetical protein
MQRFFEPTINMNFFLMAFTFLPNFMNFLYSYINEIQKKE